LYNFQIDIIGTRQNKILFIPAAADNKNYLRRLAFLAFLAGRLATFRFAVFLTAFLFFLAIVITSLR